MSEIVPTILSSSADDYKASIERLKPFASRVHIDITDGVFAKSTVNTSDVWWPDGWNVDIHAMVGQPSKWVNALVAMRPQLIIFHAEADEDIIPVLKQIQQAGIKAGVAIQRSTVPSDIVSALEVADHAMIFSGDLGEYGGKVHFMQLEKIRLIKKINPKLEIGWDGGISINNVAQLANGGIDVLNTGGAIQRASDPAAAYAKLVEESKRQDIF